MVKHPWLWSQICLKFSEKIFENDKRLVQPHERHFKAYVRKNRLETYLPTRCQEFVPPSSKQLPEGKRKFKSQEPPTPNNM